MRSVRLLVLVAVVGALLAWAIASASATVSGPTCTFYRGTTTCTSTHGSHGSITTHQGQINSNGDQQTSTTCKQTGSPQTDTC
jgi:hypothetical protein